MFKKRDNPQYKTTGELLCIYRQEAVDAMIEVTKKLNVESPETTLLLNKVSGYVAGLEDLVVNYCSAPRPNDFLPLDWMKQRQEQNFPPVVGTPWLNIGDQT